MAVRRGGGSAGASDAVARSELGAAEAALARGAWEDARAGFERVVAIEASARAYEGLGWACWWLDDVEPLVRAREAAYRLFRREGDPLGAARSAMWLAVDHLEFRGETAVSNGWFRRAETLLEPVPTTIEHGWLRLIEADTALTSTGDVVRAGRAAGEAAALGRTFGDLDCTMMALAVQGFALVSQGDVSAGNRCLDEAAAAATSGELSRPSAPIWILCYLIYACEQVRDVDRVAQWCERMREVADRLRFLFPRGICRVHYAGVLLLRGLWLDAERELLEAEAMFDASRPPWIVECRVRLAELRRRQGRLGEAETMFRALEWHPLALLGLAELALDAERPREADELCARLLRRLPERASFQRCGAWELVARCAAAVGDDARAAEAAREVERLGATVTTLPFRATVQTCHAMEAFASGHLDQARAYLEDAVDLFASSHSPYEEARARLDLARCLVDLGRLQSAVLEASAALSGFERLGAAFHAGRARALLDAVGRRAGVHGAVDAADGPSLTPRQAQVLQLVAQGMADHGIASELGLSRHTVHRHVANILVRLAVPNRAAAVAHAVARRLI